MESLMDSSTPQWDSAGESGQLESNYSVWMSAADISQMIQPALHPIAGSLTVTVT